MVRRFFLLSHFLVVEDYELSSSKSAINPGIRQNSILVHLFFFFINFIPVDVQCKIAIWARDTSLSS